MSSFLEKARYLGVFIITGRKFKLSLSEPICKFYKSVNGILSKCAGSMNEIVLLNLFNAYCKPFIMYACESVALTKSEYARLSNAWNSIFWKLFKVNDPNCINDILRFTGNLPVLMDIDVRRFSFLSKLVYTDNSVLQSLHNMFAKTEMERIAKVYNLPKDCSAGKFKNAVHDCHYFDTV